jgi:hypothetical protein
VNLSKIMGRAESIVNVVTESVCKEDVRTRWPETMWIDLVNWKEREENASARASWGGRDGRPPAERKMWRGA